MTFRYPDLRTWHAMERNWAATTSSANVNYGEAHQSKDLSRVVVSWGHNKPRGSRLMACAVDINLLEQAVKFRGKTRSSLSRDGCCGECCMASWSGLLSLKRLLSQRAGCCRRFGRRQHSGRMNERHHIGRSALPISPRIPMNSCAAWLAGKSSCSEHFGEIPEGAVVEPAQRRRLF